MEHTYYIGGRNGYSIVERALNELGWKQIKDKEEANCQLYWCELKSSIDYSAFCEGKQMVNHIPNCSLITNKLCLMNNLQEYERACSTVRKNVKPLDFLPETYRIDEARDIQKFSSVYKDNEVWICKPTGRNQGKGIFLVRNLRELEFTLDNESSDQTHNIVKKPLHRIIQRYIYNPLLVDNRKFDIRCYMLVSSTTPYLVLYHKGYLRLSMYEYTVDSDNITTHLTNQFIQKKDPKYAELREETAWSIAKFNDYVNNNLAADKNLEHDWALNILPKRLKEIIGYIFDSVRHKLERKVGYFELYGLDFMIDENMKVWLIEVNINPCLATNCSALKEVVPGVVQESLHIAIECFEKARTSKPLLPLSSMKNFEIVFQEDQKAGKRLTAATKPSHSKRTPTQKRTGKAERKVPSAKNSDKQMRPKSTDKQVEESTSEKKLKPVKSQRLTFSKAS